MWASAPTIIPPLDNPREIHNDTCRKPSKIVTFPVAVFLFPIFKFKINLKI